MPRRVSCRSAPYNIRPDRFLVMREASERAYRNANMKPLKHSAYLRLALLKERHWPFEDRLAALGRITAEDVRKFAPSLFEKVRLCLLLVRF